MRDLWILMAITVALGWVVQNTTVYPQRTCHSKWEHWFLVLIILLLLGGFIGLRTRMNDTYTYKQSYEMMSTLPVFWETFDKAIGSNPGFNIVNAWLKNNGVSTQNFLMFYSLVTNGLYIYCLRRYSDRLPLAIFLFFAVGAYIFTGAAIKQSIAMAICMASLGLALKKKWIPFILMVALASMFHPYSLMYLMVPFLTFRPWTRRTYWMLAAFILVGFGLEQLLGTVVDITSMMGEEYDVTSFSEEGVNIFRVLVCNVPTILTFLFQKQLFKDSSRGENLMVNLCMLNGAIMFVGLFGTANYFARLANYFVLAQAIALPWILGKLKGRTRSVLTAAMVVCYLGYFIYGNVFDQPFDMDFNRLTLDEYFIAFFQ